MCAPTPKSRDPRCKKLSDKLLQSALTHYEQYAEIHEDSSDEESRFRHADADFEIGAMMHGAVLVGTSLRLLNRNAVARLLKVRS